MGNLLIYMRFAEIALLALGVHLVLNGEGPSRYRAQRLSIATALLFLNIATILIRVFLMHRPLL